MMLPKLLSRRRFLTGVGGVSLAAPLLPSVGKRVRAQTASPRRSIFFYTPNGCITNRWFPSVVDGSLSAADLMGTSLEALAPFTERLLIPRGLRSLNEYGVTQTIDPHQQATGSKLSCATIDEASGYANAHSVDYAIASQINPLGDGPLVIHLGPEPEAEQLAAEQLLSYSAPLTPSPVSRSPIALFEQLSGLEYQALQKMSIIDAVKDDLDFYRARNMATRDRQRLDAWLELLRTTELSLSCLPAAVELSPEDIADASEGDFAAVFSQRTDAMLRLLALTLSCDVNRSVVVSFSPHLSFDWDSIQTSVEHRALSHRSGAATVGEPCVEGVHDQLAAIDAWFAGKFAMLVGVLGSLPEGQGSVLDSVAAVWLPEFSDGAAHNLNNLPIVIAGSCGGALRQGVSLNVDDAALGTLDNGNSEADCDEDDQDFTGSTGGNVPINKLYVTLMNALGCTAPDGGEVTSFGSFDGQLESDGITDPGQLSALLR